MVVPKPERVFNLERDTSGPRPLSAIRLICLHTTEGHNRPGIEDLVGLANYFNGPIEASATIANDAEGNDVRLLRDDQIPWTQGRKGHSRNFNRESLSIEQIGFAATPRAAWLSTFMPQVENTALWVAYWTELYSLPTRKSTTKGVCQHADISGPGGHWDCGPGYPFDVMLEIANDLRQGRIPAPSREDVWKESQAAVKRWRKAGHDTLKDAGEASKALLRDRTKTDARQRAVWQASLQVARRLAKVHGWGADLGELEALLGRLLKR